MKWFVVLMIAAMLTSACGSSSSASDNTSGNTDSADVGAAFDPAPSPLMVYFGIDGSSDDQEAVYRDQELKRQEWITKCMADQGFTYRNNDSYDIVSYDDQREGEPAWGSRAWVERYGLGVSTQAFDQAAVGSDLVGYPVYSETAQAEADPNEEYLSSLTEAESQAYNEALYGTDPGYEWDQSMSDEENSKAAEDYYQNDFVPSGCYDLSQEQVQSEDPFGQLYEAFGDELNAMYERVQADPQMIAALDELSRCMSDVGLVYTDEQTAYEEFNERVEPINETVTWPGNELTEEQQMSMSEAEVEAIYNAPSVMSDEGKAQLAQLQADEIAFGLALFDCGSADLYPIAYTIQSRLEQDFINAHGAELEAMRN